MTYFLFHNVLFSSMVFNFQVCCYFLGIIDVHFLPTPPPAQNTQNYSIFQPVLWFVLWASVWSILREQEMVYVH